jgi:ferredoxin
VNLLLPYDPPLFLIFAHSAETLASRTWIPSPQSEQAILNLSFPADPLTLHCFSTITIAFQDSKGTPIAQAHVEEGESILDAAHNHGVDLQGDSFRIFHSFSHSTFTGICESSLACSTCHVVLEPSAFSIFEPPGEQEDDMLAFVRNTNLNPAYSRARYQDILGDPQ